jgi:DNA-binding FadR family transcriptional regulator
VSGLLSPKEQRGQVLEVHAAISQAIAAGRSDEAERLMREHMQEYADWVLQRHPQLMEQVISWR